MYIYNMYVPLYLQIEITHYEYVCTRGEVTSSFWSRGEGKNLSIFEEIRENLFNILQKKKGHHI